MWVFLVEPQPRAGELGGRAWRRSRGARWREPPVPIVPVCAAGGRAQPWRTGKRQSPGHGKARLARAALSPGQSRRPARVSRTCRQCEPGRAKVCSDKGLWSCLSPTWKATCLRAPFPAQPAAPFLTQHGVFGIHSRQRLAGLNQRLSPLLSAL